MTDRISDANCFARDQQRRTTAAASIGFNLLKPVVQFQASLLRLWAYNMERFAGNYEKGLEETATVVKEQSEKARAAWSRT